MCHRDKLILITNQRGISRGKIAISDFLDRSKTKKFNQGNDFFFGGGGGGDVIVVKMLHSIIHLQFSFSFSCVLIYLD